MSASLKLVKRVEKSSSWISKTENELSHGGLNAFKPLCCVWIRKMARKENKCLVSIHVLFFYIMKFLKKKKKKSNVILLSINMKSKMINAYFISHMKVQHDP